VIKALDRTLESQVNDYKAWLTMIWLGKVPSSQISGNVVSLRNCLKTLVILVIALERWAEHAFGLAAR